MDDQAVRRVPPMSRCATPGCPHDALGDASQGGNDLCAWCFDERLNGSADSEDREHEEPRDDAGDGR